MIKPITSNKMREFTKHPVATIFIFSTLFFVLVYGSYIMKGGFIYDDRAISYLGEAEYNLSSAFSATFPLFINRPLAPLFYGLITRLGTNPLTYILIDVCMWCSASIIIGLTLRRQIGNFPAQFFILFAGIPSFSTTLIFSPGMQSVGTFAILLHAISLWLLNRSITRKSKLYFLGSYIPLLMMSLCYEVGFPLLILSIVWPLLYRHNTDYQKVFKVNLMGIISVIFLMLMYQKIIAPMIFGESSVGSRLRITSLSLTPLIDNIRFMTIFLSYDLWNLARKSFSQLKNQYTFASYAPLLLSFVILIFSAIYLKSKATWNSCKLSLLMLSVTIGILGIGAMHYLAGVGPTIYGYANRGLGSLSILAPLAASCVLSYILNKSRKFNFLVIFLFIGCYFIYLITFLMQRNNYIESAKVQMAIVTDLHEKIIEQFPENKPETPQFIIGNVPEFFANNLNGETIFSGEVTDWNMTLVQSFPGKYTGATLTEAKVCDRNKRFEVSTNNIAFFNPEFSMPIKGSWYYEYNLEFSRGELIKIENSTQLQKLIQSRYSCK